MSSFTIILLIIILVLIASDVFFLWKIFKTIGSKKKSIPDERYFELKYNINLLKAVSAILIFLFGFLGFTTYKDITKIVESDFEKKFEVQQRRIDKLDSIVKDYEETVQLLKSEEGKSIENLNDVRSEFRIINQKVSQTQESLKYTPQIFVVKNLKYSQIEGRKTGLGEGLKFYFKDFKTIYGESLPKFSSSPLVNLQGDGAEFVIVKKTKEYFEIMLYVSSGNEGNEDLINFDVWIVSLN